MSNAPKSNVAELNMDMANQMKVLRDDIAELRSTVAEYSKVQAGSMKSTAMEKVSDIADSGASAARAVKVQAEKTYSDAETAVRQNPLAAVGIAVGISVLIGMLSARR